MATSDSNRPVSAENAKKMFNDISADILDRTSSDVLSASTYDGFGSSAETVSVVCVSGEYDSYTLEFGYDYMASSSTAVVVEVGPSKTSASSSNVTVNYSFNSTQKQAIFKIKAQNRTLYRIIGHKATGGGSSLLDLLRSILEGVE